MRTRLLFALLATAFTCSLFTAPAFAARDRVFVASYGNDDNPCTFGSPCKTFQNAYSVVATGGEVTAIDSAGFGPLSISKSVTITSPAGVEAGIQAAAGEFAAITISAPGASVVLSGLTVSGADAGVTGIYVQAAANLEVVNCAIRGFTNGESADGTGINLEVTAPINFLISNTIVADNSNGIVYGYNGASTAASANGVIDHVVATNNHSGIAIFSSSIAAEPAYFTISNSTISNNTGDGLDIVDSVASRFVVNIDSSYFNNNQGDGIFASGVGSSTVVLLGRSVISANGLYGITYTNSTFATYGDNRINWNGTNDLNASLDNTDDTLK
jgi:hypothetical protein